MFGMGTGGSASPKSPGDDFTLLTRARQTIDAIGASSRKESIAPRKCVCQSASTGLHGGIPRSGFDGIPGAPRGLPTGYLAVSGSLPGVLTCDGIGASLSSIIQIRYGSRPRLWPGAQSIMDKSPIIIVQDLTKRYGPLLAVDRVSFSVHREEVFGILGPNGAGKTTTVEILEGMRTPDSGSATVNGADVTRDPQAVKAMIGVQLQASAFFDGLNLAEILHVFGSLYRTRVNPGSLLDRVEMGERARSQYKDLSGGQKQRFSIAVALVNDPVLLFLDEPTTGLDPQARRHMWELISRLQTEGKTVVLTTHYMEEAETLCNRVAIMDEGRVIALDSPAALVRELLEKGFHRPQPVQAGTLEDVFLDLTGKQLRED